VKKSALSICLGAIHNVSISPPCELTPKRNEPNVQTLPPTFSATSSGMFLIKEEKKAVNNKRKMMERYKSFSEINNFNLL
jgi:hypothetical protein